LWTAAKNGLNITVPTGAGRRNPSDQSSFRHNLICVSNAKHSDLYKWEFLWCPITRTWSTEAKAAHLFAYHHGQDMMTYIFGVEAIGELFSVKNGILMSTRAEERFDKGLFVIVPDVNDPASQHDIDKWNASEPKEYKIRVLDKDSQLMKAPVQAHRPENWIDLDGQRVEFRNDHRPRSRYLYFHYCVSILRRSWNQNKRWELLKMEVASNMWATPGRYLRKAMLAAIAEEIGHDMEKALMKGCKDPETRVDKVDETALVCANDQIRITSRSGQELKEEIQKSATTLVESEDEDEDYE